LIPAINESRYEPTLLHGVTGSGKTEVYIQLIIHAFNQGKTTILLLPEVTLSLQFERLLRSKLPEEIAIFGFHCASTAKNKKNLWRALVEQKPILIVGVHMPIMLPIAQLGLIIIDEEHEVGFQEKKHPKINTKEAALLRAYIAHIPILLGSATPSITSLYNVNHKNWALFELKNRFAGAFPTVKTVTLNDKKERRQFWISRELEHALIDRLHKKEQAIIYINRRGLCFFLQCSSCSFVFSCINCSVSLTPHKDGILYCHYCDYSLSSPSACPACKKNERSFIKKGIGTQQIVTILEKLLPKARIARADLDTTSQKKAWHETVEKFTQKELDILVGTQTITKGYHFPNVTLVGVIWADLNLNFPLYNASETTLQRLIQVAGRAGRQHHESLVIVQTMSDHPIFSYLNEIEYRSFYEHELENRALCNYPPFKRLVLIELKNIQESTLEQEALDCARTIRDYAHQKNLSVTILGPAQPLVSKIMNTHVRQMYLKGDSITELIILFKVAQHKKYASSLFFTPNPVT
jgi:primosomal protein N' (replication factor Y) (superfamily II helicase)